MAPNTKKPASTAGRGRALSSRLKRRYARSMDDQSTRRSTVSQLLCATHNHTIGDRGGWCKSSPTKISRRHQVDSTERVNTGWGNAGKTSAVSRASARRDERPHRTRIEICTRPSPQSPRVFSRPGPRLSTWFIICLRPRFRSSESPRAGPSPLEPYGKPDTTTGPQRASSRAWPASLNASFARW